MAKATLVACSCSCGCGCKTPTGGLCWLCRGSNHASARHKQLLAALPNNTDQRFPDAKLSDTGFNGGLHERYGEIMDWWSKHPEAKDGQGQ